MRSPSDPPNSEKARKPERPRSREDRLKAALKANMAQGESQVKMRENEYAARDSEKD